MKKIILIFLSISTLSIAAYSQEVVLSIGKPCLGETLEFAYTGDRTEIQSWAVSAGGEIISGGEPQNSGIAVKWNSPGPHYVIARTPEAHEHKLYINEYVKPSVTITTEQENGCSGQPVSFRANPAHSGASPQYKWFIDDQVVGSEASISFEHTFSGAGNYAVKVGMTSSATCIEGNAYVESSPWNVTVENCATDNFVCTTDMSKICLSLNDEKQVNVNFDMMDGAYNWQWKKYNYETETWENFGSQSSGTAATAIFVNDKRKLYYEKYLVEAEVSSGSWLSSGEIFVYHFPFDDCTEGCDESSGRSVNPEGDCDVALNVTCWEICMDPEECCWPIEGTITNIFTPNNDGYNDTWPDAVWQGRVVEYNLRIENRWGTEVFETNDVNEDWDGDVPTGTYYWYIEVKCEYANGDFTKELNGSVLVLY